MPFFRLDGTFTSTRKLLLACAATFTDVRPISAPPVPRRMTRTLTTALAALPDSFVTRPVRLPALAPAGSELSDVTPTPAACAARSPAPSSRERDQ